MKNIIALVALMILLTGCFLDPKIDASDEDSFQSSLQEIMTDMNEDDKKTFSDNLQVIMFENINDFSDLMQQSQNEALFMASFYSKVDGKSAKEINKIANGIKSKKEKTQDAVEEAPVNNVEKIKKDGLKNSMNTLIQSEFTGKNYDPDKFTNEQELVFTFKNTGDKDIKGLKGTAIFSDIFGDQIMKIGLSLDEQIPAGEMITYTGYVDINQYTDNDVKLANTSIDKIQFKFDTELVLFEDGTKLP